ARGTVPLDELVQEGNLGLLRAVEKYDPDAGTRFATYALWWIRAYVWRYLRAARSSVRPRSGETARADLSLEAPVHDDGDATWLDQVEDDRPAADDRYAEAEAGARLRGALRRARPRIGEIGWDVIHSRLQQDPPDTLAEIGRRWGVSRERVRQIEVKTKRFLRDYLEPAKRAA
ncbi:MAG TPA: sigma-70 family RNA polymerase sigma factor, partial [Anaeromyxobacteraceae bacterium]|nr:sigma-70 family RNA polymerase sigma factor [Anaeromyxobacteraceae bacterium]